MRMDEIKISKCEQCNSDMPVYNKRQRFCSVDCKNNWWIKERARKLKAKKALGKRDLFGFVIAAE